MRRLDYARLKRVNEKLGYPFFDDGDYDMNIIGIRTDDSRSDLFNDWICLAFRQNDHEQLLVFSATTDPGVYWREHPMNVNGTAILKQGHHSSMFRLGKHRGRYPALIQDAPCTVYRDANHDAALDNYKGIPQERGRFGINLHRATAHGTSNEVGRWSAGCQVIADSADFNLFMEVLRRATVRWGDRFSYTLLTESQLWNCT